MPLILLTGLSTDVFEQQLGGGSAAVDGDGCTGDVAGLTPDFWNRQTGRYISCTFRSAQVGQGSYPMPMIDVYDTGGTFANPKALARDLAATLMKIEQVPDIPMFRKNTAAFIHDLPDGALSNVEGDGNYVRVQVLTNAGALNRDKQLAVVRSSLIWSRLPPAIPRLRGGP